VVPSFAVTPSHDAAPSRELSVRAVVLGLSLSVVMGAANVYVGLKAGMTVSASIPAAVMAMLVFRLVFREKSLLETNQIQTGASAGESLAAGIIFTMPALVIIGVWQDFDFWTVTLVALAGGTLGVLFMIPMRRVFVVGRADLPYPEGVACAAVLRAGADPESQVDARPLVIGALVGGAFKALVGIFGVLRGVLEGAFSFGRVIYLGADVSPMLVAVGAIVGLNVAALLALGSALGWLVIIPVLSAGMTGDPLEIAWSLWSQEVRYVGVGAMVVGGAHSIVKVRSGLWRALQEITGRGEHRERSPDQRDLPPRIVFGLAASCLLLVGGLYYHFLGEVVFTSVALLCALVMSFFFTAVASYIVGLVGNSNSPVSGMTITAVLFTGLFTAAIGMTGPRGILAILGVAAIVCSVACTAGDVCNDLKTGQLVGATPARQQIMQLLGVLVASFVMAPVLTLLHGTTDGGIGGRNLPAPQANLFASLARALAGEGDLPMNRLLLGAGIGVAVLALDALLVRRKSRVRAHLMPIAVGLYLPFGLAPPILLGGLLARAAARRERSPAGASKTILLSSGLIAGEALMGIGFATLAALGLSSLGTNLPPPITLGATVVAIVGLVVLLRRFAER
jgi:putative OPT family oligopeptide transporter